MEPTSTQIWRHVRSGEQYAVEVDFSGTVIGAAGPLHWREVEAARDGFDADPALTTDIDDDQQSYALVEVVRNA